MLLNISSLPLLVSHSGLFLEPHAICSSSAFLNAVKTKLASKNMLKALVDMQNSSKQLATTTATTMQLPCMHKPSQPLSTSWRWSQQPTKYFFALQKLPGIVENFENSLAPDDIRIAQLPQLRGTTFHIQGREKP